MQIEELFQHIDGERGAPLVARYLAEGGNVNAVCPGIGWTLLHVAAEHRNLALIRRLVTWSANVHARDGEGWTPLHVAVDSDIEFVWQKRGYAYEIDFGAARLLVTLGANLGLLTVDGRSARDIAAQYGAPTLRRFDELLG